MVLADFIMACGGGGRVRVNARTLIVRVTTLRQSNELRLLHGIQCFLCRCTLQLEDERMPGRNTMVPGGDNTQRRLL